MQDEMNPAEAAKVTQLDEIKQDVADGKEPSISVRKLLRWFGASRCGTSIVERIEAELEEADLRTDPHFTTTWIDAPVTFGKREPDPKAQVAVPLAPGAPQTPDTDGEKAEELAGTTHLVRMLDAANREVVSIKPQDPIEKAITLMLAHDFSQLAVMTGPRDLKEAISWKSIGSRLSQRKERKEARDAMEQAAEVHDSDSLFETTKTIIQRTYVFVRSSVDNKTTGIVTATDLSEQFQKLSEPFLLLGRIENQIRRTIEKVFDAETFRAACDDNDPERKAAVTRASQLTFGEYQRIFENETNWQATGFVACRKTFCRELDETRKLRNEIMHFHPDVLEESDFEHPSRESPRPRARDERSSRSSAGGRGRRACAPRRGPAS